jgi:4-amino-4-deoxy-L-arabinose transferase-like glycosyltransferase
MRPSLKGALAFAQVLGGLGLLGLFLSRYLALQLNARLGDYELLTSLGPGEADFAWLLLLTAVPASLLIGAGLGSLLPGSISFVLEAAARRPRAVVVALSLTTAVLVLLARRFITLGADFTDDERTYWYQAQVLLSGHFIGPLITPPLFSDNFTVVTASGNGVAGIFPLGQALLMAFGSLAGDRSLWQWLAAAGTVGLTWRLAQIIFADPRTSLLAALLVAISPWMIGVAATHHNAVPSCFFALVALVAALEHAAKASAPRALAAGASLGLAFLIRPLDGLMIGLVVAAIWLVALRRSAAPARAIGLIVAGLCAALAVASTQLISNALITGSPLRTPYALWISQDTPGASLFGFGTSVWGQVQTLGSAATKTGAALVRVGEWQLGSLLSLPLLFWAALDARLRRTGWPLWLFIALLGLGYALYMFPSVQDFGSLYHLPLLPSMAVLCAAALVRLAARVGASRVAAWVFATVLVAGITFWSTQAVRIHLVAQRISRPLEIAQQAAVERPLLVLWTSIQGPGRSSWVFNAPLPSPALDEPVIWAEDKPALYAALAQRFPNRRLMRLVWKGVPTLEPIAP